MLGATVFIFLLEQLPGFQVALNSTLQAVALYKNGDEEFKTYFVQRCDPIVAESFLSNIKNDIKRDIYNGREHENYFQRSNELNPYEVLSPENSYNIGTVFENSIEDSDNLNSLEATNNINENNNKQLTNLEDRSEFNKDVFNDNFNETNIESMSDEIKFPQKVPFLVAIFETMSNVTTQTCGGTLLSPNWVLTAASCVNLLSHLYSNRNRTELNAANVSAYIIVAGSANPFMDGTKHRVTELTLLPNEFDTAKLSNIDIGNWTKSNRGIGNTSPTLAMMRIEPAVSVGILEIWRNQSTASEAVQVYGWILSKNETGQEVMRATTFRAETMRSENCRIHQHSILCLTPRNIAMDKAKQVNSGGPVVVVRNGELSVMGVAQLGRTTPFLAYPLSAHIANIDKILKSK